MDSTYILYSLICLDTSSLTTTTTAATNPRSDMEVAGGYAGEQLCSWGHRKLVIITCLMNSLVVFRDAEIVMKDESWELSIPFQRPSSLTV